MLLDKRKKETPGHESASARHKASVVLLFVSSKSLRCRNLRKGLQGGEGHVRDKV